jgi:hypothetical protein
MKEANAPMVSPRCIVPTILDRHPDWQVRTAPIHFDKEQLAHFIGSNGGVEKKAKGKYPEVLNPQNPSVVPAL